MKKLYEVPRRTWVQPVQQEFNKDSSVTVPPGAKKINFGDPIFFDHLDGMYSYCKDIHGEVVHLPAWQEVSITEPC